MKNIIKIIKNLFKKFKCDFYLAVMFPYPSGNGLHIGHFYNYALTDSYGNYLRYLGKKVFQPFGYDSFGLPAENYARSISKSPGEVTKNNIKRFRKQMKDMNTKYEDLLITSSKSYQKWTKWIFKLLYKNDLIYKAKKDVHYCPSCKTVLAKEQVNNDKCKRCNTHVTVKNLDQWFFKITDYKERLLKNIDNLDYPESTIKQQKEWINNLNDWCVSRQRKWGCPIPIKGEEDTLDTFVDSSFYFLRYLDPYNPFKLFRKNRFKQVDLYVGGVEHSCMHLIYARFINMVLYDLGYTKTEEPFKKVFHQGVIKYKNEKMSKSKGNAINPSDYNPDELRFYLMFIGPYKQGGDWDDKNIRGIRRFINKFSKFLNKENGNDKIDIDSFRETIFSHTENFKFNKVVSSFMIFLNKNKNKNISKSDKKELLKLIRIYMPGFK